MKARDVSAALAGRSGKRRNLMLMGVVLALSVAAAIGSSASSIASPPTLTIDSVASPGIVTAHLSGEVSVPADGNETYWGFEYAEEGQGNWSGFPASGTLQPGESEHVTSDLSGLKAETKYEVRLVTHDAVDASEEFSAVETFATAAAVAPTLTLDTPSGVTATAAHLAGTVDPNGGNEDPSAGVLPIAWELQLSREGGGWETVDSGELSGAEAQSTAAQDVSADAAGLLPNAQYRARLLARYAGLQLAEPEEASFPEAGAEFTTDALAPEVGDSIPHAASETTIILSGTVNPRYSPLSDCHFAYGVGTALDRSAPCESLPTGNEPVNVQAKVTGLAPGTEYFFQLSAANAGGVGKGPVHRFSTPNQSEAVCPNEAIRVAQDATQIGDCRAWERVSPADKGGGDLVAEGEPIVAAADGEKASFVSRYGFADTQGSGNVGRTVYLANRGSGGWSTHAVTPLGNPVARQIVGPTTHSNIFSSDLSRVLTFGYDLPGATDDAPERMNMYLEDTATRALRTISSSQRGDGKDPIQYWPNEFANGNELFGASEDFSHVTLESWTQYLPTGTAPGYPQGQPRQPSFFFPYAYTYRNVYTWDDGILHLAGVLPDGSAPPEGSRVDPRGVLGTMSADGSRQMFLASPTAGAPQQLYLRVDRSRTAFVSESENEGIVEEARNIFFEGMTPDGKNVFFVTDSPLLEEDENEAQDLYRWKDGPDPEHEDNLRLITSDGSAFSSPDSFGGALIGMSDDGSRVYVHSIGGRLELWEEGNGIRTIDPSVPRPIQAVRWLTLLATMPGKGRVSPDGNWLAYVPEAGGLRVYDRRLDTVVTVADDASFDSKLTEGGAGYPPGFRPRFLSKDGKVFFTSREALVPQDTNGVADVYEYDGAAARLSLLTSGKGSEPMEFGDASADGRDVFFLTRAQLVPSDTDEFIDLYDARIGGGFDEPELSPVAPCTGESCQVAGAAPAMSPGLSSRAHTRGNVKAGHRRCGRSRRAVRRHGKVRCLKRHRKHRQHGKQQRRAARTNGGSAK